MATRMEHGRCVFAEIDAVVKAHQEGVSISGIFVSICPARRVQCVNYIFPMIPALLLTSAGKRDATERRNIREDVIYLILCRRQNGSEGNDGSDRFNLRERQHRVRKRRRRCQLNRV